MTVTTGSSFPRLRRRVQKHFNIIFITIVAVALLSLFLLDSRSWSHLTRGVDGEVSSSHDLAADPLQRVTEIGELLSSHLDLTKVDELYVIPGGGTGASTSGKGGVNAGYPEWTRRRVVAAYEAWRRSGSGGTANSPKSLFLALSAGSLNSANLQTADKRIVFESQHTIQHLRSLGVDSDIIYGDFMSWDTVTNALYVRMFIEGLLSLKGITADALSVDNDKDKDNNDDKGKGKGKGKKLLKVDVFISDFHADRTRAAMKWVLGVQPSLLTHKVDLLINIVGSEGIDWGGKSAFNDRLRHERAGVEMLKRNEKVVVTREQLYAFVFMGGHKGLRGYLSGAYRASEGPGW